MALLLPLRSQPPLRSLRDWETARCKTHVTVSQQGSAQPNIQQPSRRSTQAEREAKRRQENKPPSSLSEALNRQRQLAEELSGRQPRVKPSFPPSYASQPPTRQREVSQERLEGHYALLGLVSGTYDAELQPAPPEVLPDLSHIGGDEKVRKAKKDARVPKQVSGMGAYAARVKDRGLGSTAVALDVVQAHPSFASAEAELKRMEEQRQKQQQS